MKYTREERMAIGKEICDTKISSYEAAAKYGINQTTASSYARYYRAYKDAEELPPTRRDRSDCRRGSANTKPKDLEELEQMSKEELIQEVMNSRIREERAKKGYEVKGVGADKEYIPLDSKNTK